MQMFTTCKCYSSVIQIHLREMRLSNILLSAQFSNVFSIQSGILGHIRKWFLTLEFLATVEDLYKQDYKVNSFYDFFLTSIYPDILRKNSKPQEYFVQ